MFLSCPVIQLAPSPHLPWHRHRSARRLFSQLPFASLKIFLALFSPAMLAHEVPKHPLVCHTSSATVCLPRTQIKGLRVSCVFQFLTGSGLPSACLLGAGRKSREDLQIWTLALSKRKGRKLRLVNCFWIYSQDLSWISSTHKLLETLSPCIPFLSKIPLKYREMAKSRDQIKPSGPSLGHDEVLFTLVR